jgi:hypothetical protein
MMKFLRFIMQLQIYRGGKEGEGEGRGKECMNGDLRKR